MIKSPSLDIIRSFSNEEFKRFQEFLLSPYFNKNSNLVKIAEYFKKVIPMDDNDKLSNEKIWNAVYGKKEFNYGIMKNLVYELKKITEKFLAVEHFDKEELTNDLFIINEFNQRALGELFEKKIHSTKKKIEQSKIDIDKLFFLYETNKVDSSYKENLFRKESDKLTNDEDLSNSFLSYFFASKFYLLYNQLINSKFFNSKPNLKSIRIFVDLYDNTFKGINILSDLYFYSVKMTLEPDNIEHYKNLKALFFKHFDLIENESLNNFTSILTAYCQLTKPESKTNFVKEEFDIYCFALEKGIYNSDHNKYFDSNLFSRLVELSILLDKPNWCREFIDKYKKRLSPTNKMIRTQIAEIYLQNHLKNYEYALEILSKAKPESIIENFKIRSIEIMIFFKLKDYERVYALLKNFRSYLEYDGKVSELVFKVYVAFLNYTKSLVDILVNHNNNNDSKIKLDEILVTFNKEKIANKTWLRSVIKELQGAEKGNVKSKRI